MLLALAGTIHMPAMPLSQVRIAVWLIILFVWTSMLAMILRAISGEPGFGFSGSGMNRFIFVVYAIGTVAVFPGFLWLFAGLIRALWS